MTFRWYGEKDSIPLSYIRQIPGVGGVVSAVYDTPVGEVWTKSQIEKLVTKAHKHCLALEVIESVPVHEDIKLGRKERDRYIENYRQTILNLSQYGIKCVCYNFMPVFDWLRTNLSLKNEDESTALAFCWDDFVKINPQNLHLPGWDESYNPQEMRSLMQAYSDVTHDMLFENLIYFLERVVPVCEECGVVMAIHPDDPPWDIFDLPRIVSCERDIDRIFSRIPSKSCALTFCTGSLGALKDNDLVNMAKKYCSKGKIPFAHLRNVLRTDECGSFKETAHTSSSGSLDMAEIVKAMVDFGFDGYVRPDHGRQIWGESGKPGYGLYDRALGAAYINGLFEMAEKR